MTDSLSSFVSRPFAAAFADYAASRPDVVCVNGDLTTSTEADIFRARFPERFFALGMAEQNLVGIAAGMAREGCVPFYTTFSVFGTRRPYDQIAMSIAVPRLPVRIVGFLPGLTTPGGATHQAIDDVALMRVLPNMTVLDLGDATEIQSVWPAFDAIEGPVFCRAMRGDVPRLFDRAFEFGRARVLHDGREVVVLSSGAATRWTMPAVTAVRGRGADVAHLHISTLKPFDDPNVAEAIQRARRGVVTVENHLVEGGLGTAVATMIAESGLARPLVRVGLRDTFARGGSLPYLLERFGLSTDHVVAAIEGLFGWARPARGSAAGVAGGGSVDSEAEGL